MRGARGRGCWGRMKFVGGRWRGAGGKECKNELVCRSEERDNGGGRGGGRWRKRLKGWSRR